MDMSSKVVTFKVESVSPILMHNPVGLMKQAAPGMERAGKNNPLLEVEARDGLYKLPIGQLYIPADAFREAGVIAAGDVKDNQRKGRATMTKRFGAAVFLSKPEFPLFRLDGETPITDDADDWEV